MALRALARVNLAAIERNVGWLRSSLSGQAELCAVVKADGYGHGAAPAARAALAGGATWLAVATADEAAELRAAGLSEPTLVMGAVSSEELGTAIAAGAELVAWDRRFTERLAAAAAERDSSVRVHVKLDTGMGRLGTRDRAEAFEIAELIARSRGALELAGAMTHFATADDDPEFLDRQLSAFEPFASELRSRFPGIVVHAANSAATLRSPASHFDLVRCGIAIYGCDPMHEEPSERGLEPALALSSYVAAVKLAQSGESIGYGRRFVAERDTWIGTLPIGYGDGVRRALTNNCDVLLRGQRYPLVGTVSMDNITVDLGPEPGAQPGDEAILIGTDGGERQTAEQLARRIGTINYEIVCGISSRVPRAYHHDGEPIG
ncbi:MAG: alanine racemase [Actinobacteria bacterium]|nr:MAG: alanine racemase [Actinomycetota bacterium]